VQRLFVRRAQMGRSSIAAGSKFTHARCRPLSPTSVGPTVRSRRAGEVGVISSLCSSNMYEGVVVARPRSSRGHGSTTQSPHSFRSRLCHDGHAGDTGSPGQAGGRQRRAGAQMKLLVVMLPLQPVAAGASSPRRPAGRRPFHLPLFATRHSPFAAFHSTARTPQ
jgi:hypothetical protein